MTTSPFDRWREETRHRVNQSLLDCLDQKACEHLLSAMRYSIEAGGKRLRPLLCLATCELFEQPPTEAINAACAIELLHSYSLIHDDLPAMDDDDLRRGKPSCHKAFDEATAILAGDALLTLAFELLSDDESSTPEQRLAMIKTLSSAAGANGMVAGQMLDMLAENRQLDLASLNNIHHLKTGRLIAASLLLGAQAAGINTEEQLAPLQRLGSLIGLAFQVQDDILDITGDPQLLGKQKGADANLNKSTFPALMGLEGSQAYAAKLGQEALDLLAPYDTSAHPLRELVKLTTSRTH